MPLGVDPKEFGRLLGLSQIGFEMVVPIVLGWALDYYLGWTPWGIIVGAVLGFLTGMLRIVNYLNRQDDTNPRENGK